MKISEFKKIFTFKLNIGNILGTLGFLISIYSIYLTKEEHKMRVAEFEASQVPAWNLQLSYGSNNLDLISAEFSSRNNENILLNGLTIYCPSDMGDSFQVNIEGNKWLCFGFFEKINQKLNEYIKLPQTDIVFEGYLNKEVRYPIAIKFKYFYGQKEMTYTDIYLIHFIYYTDDKFKIKGWELIKKTPEGGSTELTQLLNKINHEKGFLYEQKIANRIEEEFVLLDNFITILNQNKSFKFSFSNQSNSGENYSYSITLPYLYCDSSTSMEVFNYWELLDKNLKKYPSSIVQDIKRIKDFINRYPPNSFQFLGGKDDPWVKDPSIIKEWNSIMGDFRTHFELQIQLK